MTRKFLVGVNVVLLAVVAGVLIYRSGVDLLDDEIQTLAETLRKSGDESLVAVAGRARRLEGLLTEDCVVRLGRPAPPGLEGRERIVNAFLALWKTAPELDVHFRNVDVTHGEDTSSAVVELIAVASSGGRQEERRVRLHWTRADRTWRMQEIEEISRESNRPGREP